MSRYHTLYTNDGTAKFTTLLVGGTSVSTPLQGRRLTVLTGNQSPFLAFGTSTAVASTSSCVIPANATVDFNVTVGTHVALISPGGATYVTVIDAD